MKRHLHKLKQKNTQLLLAFVVMYLFINFIYFLLNKAPQAWDSSAHINLSMLYALKITEGRFFELLTLSGYYPPFAHYIGSAIYLLTKSVNLILLSSYLYYIVAVLYLYQLIKLVLKSKNQAILGIIMFSLIPQVAVELRLFQLDLPLTALIIASMYHLANSNKLASNKNTIAFFVFFAFAMLTKWYAFVYIIIPFLFTINYKKITTEVIKNFLVGNTVFFVITLPWYAINFSSILSFFGSVSSLGELNDPQGFWTIENFTEYLNLAFAYQITFIGALITLIAWVLGAFKSPRRAFYYFLCMFVPWLVFTVLTNKDVRYIMPLVPFYVLVIVTGFSWLNLTLKKVIYGFIFTYFLVVFFIYGFYQSKKINPILGYSITSPFNKYQWVVYNPTEFSYQSQNWHIQTLYNYMVNDLDKYSNKDTKVLFAVDYRYFNSIGFNTLQIENSTYYQVTSGFGILDLRLNQANISSKLDEYKYIITAYNPGETNLRFYNDLVKINRYLQQQTISQFDSKASFKLPNGEDVYLFRNVRYREDYESNKQDIQIFVVDFRDLELR